MRCPPPEGRVIDFNSTAVADLVLVVELAMAAGLVLGMFLVRAGHVRFHAYLQSTIVLGNGPIVLVWMLPAYLQNVWPDIPGEIASPFYWVPTLMLVLGLAVEALGAYVILVAGTNLIPERFRFRRYKVWMRSVLVLWWAVLITGLATYYVWFVH
jgi:uncharacterized membrane protein YozB (DUF420 family)